MQKIIEQNDVVGIKYEVKEAKTGDVVDSNKDGEILKFIIGKGQIIPGLEKQLVGKKQDDRADILVEAKEAYGEYNAEAEQLVPIEQFGGIELEIGMPLYGQSEDGQTVAVRVKDLTDTTVLVDYNHPLAGKDLMFSVEIVKVREASEDEILSGQIKSDNDGCCGTGCGCH